jgi:hypothetical protein
MARARPAAFSPGTTIVRRDILNGRTWSAQTARVLADDGTDLALGYWPGAEALLPTPFIRWLATRSPEDPGARPARGPRRR